MKNEPKQVIVVRNDLKMRKGKIAAQAAHASVGAILSIAKKDFGYDSRGQKANSLTITIDLDDPAAIQWFEQRFKKIAVKVDSEQELLNIYQQAKDAYLPCSLIRDAGDTVFNGVPTYTTVAIGPADPDRIDAITGNLPLL